ncbi:MAG: NAD(P) transhydrogenase subunit alpha [Flavobacteriales bacterium]|nr:NAD(P) transhydrogenase subunit alpha [Flavobacteriales bacterium]MBK6943238.1 NAD(P) transhydrogenase subunit alpha [Flavobacteriales bacterium]MBK7296510.1 NAD(P) transhydrogenase subunit alpha [Flavobacteriales bacterium]MBK9536231.1 NAD(P) transhydrogenase subunit alpha [Flavobacteriales bacterium]MBP9137894.1 NAD(P) transhydrogenase subunit alpha [Flavobacteriales bacterium]
MEFSYTITSIDGLFVVALSLLVGFEVIKNIPAVLHTPLMSGSNAISGIILIGGIIQLLNTTPDSPWTMAAASLAVLLGTINIAGGFFVTHRMLSMFVVKRKPAKGQKP